MKDKNKFEQELLKNDIPKYLIVDYHGDVVDTSTSLDEAEHFIRDSMNDGEESYLVIYEVKKLAVPESSFTWFEHE